MLSPQFKPLRIHRNIKMFRKELRYHLGLDHIKPKMMKSWRSKKTMVCSILKTKDLKRLLWFWIKKWRCMKITRIWMINGNRRLKQKLNIFLLCSSKLIPMRLIMKKTKGKLVSRIRRLLNLNHKCLKLQINTKTWNQACKTLKKKVKEVNKIIRSCYRNSIIFKRKTRLV